VAAVAARLPQLRIRPPLAPAPEAAGAVPPEEPAAVRWRRARKITWCARRSDSTPCPADDDWSVPPVGSSPAKVQPASGGGTQYTVYDGCDPTYTSITP